MAEETLYLCNVSMNLKQPIPIFHGYWSFLLFLNDFSLMIKYLFQDFWLKSCEIILQVAIITPFNFPLEIPVLQLMGALYMGNKPVLKVDSKVGTWKGKLINESNLIIKSGGLAKHIDSPSCRTNQGSYLNGSATLYRKLNVTDN